MSQLSNNNFYSKFFINNVDTIGLLYRPLQKLNPTQTQTPNLNRITIQNLEAEKNIKIKKEKKKNIQNSTTSTRTGTSWIRLFDSFILIRCQHH